MDSQDQDTYVTILLSQDPQVSPTYGGQSGTSRVSLDGSPSLPSNNATNGKKSTRGVNFSLEEDKLIVIAWLNCSLDAVQGTDQKQSQLWEKISEYFQQHKETTTERTIKSLINRWSFIQKATSKFRAKLAEVEGLNQNGMTEQDRLDKAKIMYQSQEKCNFQFEHCWHLLKDQPKWVTKDDVKQRKTMFSYPTPIQTQCSVPIEDSVFDLETGNAIENEVIKLDRPMSGEAEKEKRNDQGIQEDDIIQHKMMKYTLSEDSHAQEKEFYRLMAKRMDYDKEKEEKKLHLEDERLRLKAEKLRIEAEKVRSRIHQEDERLRLKAEKMELAKKESDQRIMLMDVIAMPEVQQLYFEKLQREIMMRRGHV